MRNSTLRERWEILRAAGCPVKVARDARTSATKFRAAMADLGVDAGRWPHLINTWKGARRSYSVSRMAIDQREWRAKLKSAGYDWLTVDMWSRSKSAVEYALRAAAAGRQIPARPGLLRRQA